MRFFVCILICALIGCASLLKEHRFALNQLQLKEWVISLDKHGRLICATSDITIDSKGDFEPAAPVKLEGADCLPAPVFAYSAEDRAKLESYIQSVAEAYYGE